MSSGDRVCSSAVIPAQAGIQGGVAGRLPWTPAFAEVTTGKRGSGEK